MRLHDDLEINGRLYAKGTDVPWFAIYPFFLIHMLGFGASGFLMAYGSHRPSVPYLYAQGGLAIMIYIMFYLIIFGMDAVRWMFINAALGLLGIYTQIDWLLSYFGRRASDFPVYVHVIPFLYFVLYTFLLRHAITDLTGSRDNPVRETAVGRSYVMVSVLVYVASYYFEHR